MTYLHFNVNITCIECIQQNGWKENFLQNGLGCMRPFYACAFEALSLVLLESETLYLLHLKLHYRLPPFIITLSPY